MTQSRVASRVSGRIPVILKERGVRAGTSHKESKVSCIEELVHIRTMWTVLTVSGLLCGLRMPGKSPCFAIKGIGSRARGIICGAPAAGCGRVLFPE